MRKLILKCKYTLGDIVMLTAAVRDLHKCYPGQFLTDVRTPCPELWEHNPYLTRLEERDPDVEQLQCSYPLIDQANRLPYHCLHGFVQFLNRKLDLQIQLTAFKGDIHIARRERLWSSQVAELGGSELPFWIIVAGGKYDITIKWWDSRRYQQVVDAFRGKIQFVQVGTFGDHHPRLRGVIDLRGQTDLRQMVRLMYHAQGVLCGVTGLMHLAAAVAVRPDRIQPRACVVVAGGREPSHWEAYPSHQFIQNVGALPCNAGGPCWRSRTFPLGDGDSGDKPAWLCLETRGELPRCMDMISAAEVVGRIRSYFIGGALRFLTTREARAGRRAVAATRESLFDNAALQAGNVRAALTERIGHLPPYPSFPPPAHNHHHAVEDWNSPVPPPRLRRGLWATAERRGQFAGRGIVICGGGAAYFPSVWVCVNQLRRLGCALPIQLWHLGTHEMDAHMESMLTQLGVECVDAGRVRQRYPARLLNGWELKPYALLHSRFREVLLLDADNVPVRNPEYLFKEARFRRAGAMFWPDYWILPASSPLWRWCGLKPRAVREFESGQILVNKQKCWRALNLAMWFNEQSDFFYAHLHGDKDTFQLAFRALNQPYAMPAKPPGRLRATMLQHDLSGRRLFQHRNLDKWNLLPVNRRIAGFWFEAECRTDLEKLRRMWDGRVGGAKAQSKSDMAPAPATRGREAELQRVNPRKPAQTWTRRSPVRISACMISCAKRARIRQKTLQSLLSAGWVGPVAVQLEEHYLGSQAKNMTRDTLAGLQRARAKDPDFVLMLEDDLEFNQHFYHNLVAWPLLAQGQVTLAGLYNPGHRITSYDVPSNAVVVPPDCIFGSQAFLLSRQCLGYVLEHWDDVEGPPDVKLPRLAGRLGKPIYYHCPSLVQHIGHRSTWGGNFHEAPDYDHEWRAGASVHERTFPTHQRGGEAVGSALAAKAISSSEGARHR